MQRDEVEGRQGLVEQLLEAQCHPVRLQASLRRKLPGEQRVVRLEVGAPELAARIGRCVQVGRHALAVAELAVGVGRPVAGIGQAVQEQEEADERRRQLVVVAM
jgi:hypothetical protein